MNALSCLSIATIILLSGLFGQDTRNRRFSNTFLGYDQNQTVNNLIDGSLNQGDFNESLEPNIRSLFSNINNGQHLAAFDYSIDYLIQHFRLRELGRWYFGTDIADLIRSYQVELAQKNLNENLQSVFRLKLESMLDELQLVVDKKHFGSEIHLVLKKECAS